MNIFVLDSNPVQAARDQCNKHVVKMILESAQVLCTALHLNGVDLTHLPYKPTHTRHPSTLWTTQSPANMVWLWTHAVELCEEYSRRYDNKVHKTYYVLQSIAWLMPRAHWRDHTPFAKAMPDVWKQYDPVTAYRCYYIAEKSHFAKWEPRARTPSWWPFKEEVK